MHFSMTQAAFLSVVFVSGAAANGYAATLNGGEGNDTIAGTSSRDFVFAKGGDDNVSGNDGNDWISSGAGNDYVDGGAGNDFMILGQLYNPGTSTWLYCVDATTQSNVVSISGGDGDDVVVMSQRLPSGSIMNGGGGTDTINIGDGTPDPMQPVDYGKITGFENWVVSNTAGASVLFGSDPNSTPYPNAPTLMCLVENTTNVTILNDNVVGLEGPLTIYAAADGSGARVIDASAVTLSGIIFRMGAAGVYSKTNVLGSHADDRYYGDIESDVFRGNGGNDYFSAGDGTDTAAYSGSFADYTVTEVTYNTFTVTDIRDGSPDGSDTIVDVNKLQFADQTVDVVIKGMYIVGDDTPEQLGGGPEADLIDAKGGDDVISSGSGNDTALGGGGNDALDGGPGADVLNGGDDNDVASYVDAPAAVKADLASPAGNTGDAAGDSYVSIENVLGSNLNDTLTGDGGNNVVEGGGGADVVNGGDGNDTLNGDALAFEAVATKLSSSSTRLAIAGNDQLVGGRGNDTINGGDGADTAVYTGNLSDYTLDFASASQVTITDKLANRDGTDTVFNVENLQFADGTRTVAGLLPVISVSPTTLNFASQPINTTSNLDVTVSNAGKSILKVTGISVSGTSASSFTASNGCSSVAPSGTCKIVVSFAPTSTGANAASLSIASNANPSPTKVSLSGTAAESAPIISVTPTSVSFANQIIGTTSATKTLVVKNVGSASLTISGVSVGGTNATSFAKNGSCTSLAVNASCTLNLTFAPTVPGTNAAMLAIASNAYLSPSKTVALSGNGLAPILSQFVGTVDGPGFANGTGAAARFNAPTAIAIDALGNLYVTDSGNHLVRRITSAGAVTTLAGKTLLPGSANGTGTVAQFSRPSGIGVAGTTLYVADTGNHTLRSLTMAGVAATLAGSPGAAGAADATGAAARFNSPQGIVTDTAGNIFVADTNNATLRKVTPAGVVTTFAGTAGAVGGANGTGTAARFSRPVGLGRDAGNNLYVADSVGQTLRKVSRTAVVTTLAGVYGVAGSTDSATGSLTRFAAPSGAAVDTAGNIFVADATNATLRKVTPSGGATTFAGTAGVRATVNATGTAARFVRPVGIARDAANNLYVADTLANTIRKVTPTGAASTFAGGPAVLGANDNTGAAASFRGPTAVVSDTAGNLYVADTGNHTIRKVTPGGAVTTFAGTAGAAGAVNATGTAARFNQPRGLAIDAAGNLYVADSGNQLIRKVTPAGIVSTIAGTAGAAGTTDGIGAATRFRGPAAVAVSTTGILYVADTGNYTIRKIVLSTAQVTTLAGLAGTPGAIDGTGAAARLGLIQGLGVNSKGNLFAADFSASTIRRITPTGVVSTFAGTANARGSANGTGAAARFSSPYGLTVDAANNIYVSDYANCLLRKITPAAVVTSPVGTAGLCKFIAGNAPAGINMPTGLRKIGTTLYTTAGNGVVKIINVP